MMWYWIIAGISAAVIGVALVIWTDASMIKRRCLRRVIQAERRLDADPKQASRICESVIVRLTSLHRRAGGGRADASPAAVWPPTSSGYQAYVRAQLALATLDQRSGDHSRADQRMAELRPSLPKGAAGRTLLLEFFVRGDTITEEVLTACLEFYNSPQAAKRADLKEKVLNRIRQCCEIRPGGDENEFKQRIKWNQLVQKQLDEASWPWLNEAQAWNQLAKFERSIQIARSALAKFPEEWRLRALIVQGYVALKKKDAALQELRLLEQENLRVPAAQLEVARSLANLGQTADAEAALARIEQSDPASRRDGQLLRAKLLWRSGKHEAAMPLLKQAYDDHPQDPQAALALAEAYGRQGDNDGAWRVLQPFATAPAAVKDSQLAFGLGACLWNLGRPLEASAWFAACYRASYRVRETIVFWARCLIHERQFAKVLELLRPATQRDDALGVEANFYIGFAYWQQYDQRQAMRYYKAAYDGARKLNLRDWANASARNLLACAFRLARMHVDASEFPQAIRELERLNKNLPANDEHLDPVTKALAECYLRSGLQSLAGESPDHETAIRAIDRALNLGGAGRLQILLGGVYAAAGRYQDAQRSYDELLQRQPGSLGFRFARALCCLRGNQRDEGLSALTELARSEGQFALRAALALSAAQAETGRLDAAVDTLTTAARREAVKQDPYYAEACCNAVLYSLNGGKVNEARKLTEELLATSTGVNVNTVLGTLLAQSGDFDGALPYLETGIPGAPRTTHEHDLLRTVYGAVLHRRCDDGKFVEARELAGRAMRRSADPRISQLAALTQYASANGKLVEITADVVNQLEALVRISPVPDAVLMRMLFAANLRFADRLARSGDHARALPYWHRALTLWHEGLHNRVSFWTEFVPAYNHNKEKYKLDAPPQELEKKLSLEWAGYCVRLCGALLEGRRHCEDTGPTAVAAIPFAEAGQYWQIALKLLDKVEARKIFDEVFMVVAVIDSAPYKDDNRAKRELLSFLYKNVEERKDYLKAQGDLTFAMALDALKESNASQFMSLLDEAAGMDSQYREMQGDVRSLSLNTVRFIIRGFEQSPTGRVLKVFQPDKAVSALFIAIRSFGALAKQHGTAAIDSLGAPQLNQIIEGIISSIK